MRSSVERSASEHRQRSATKHSPHEACLAARTAHAPPLTAAITSDGPHTSH
ncbi:hypothetical protein ABID47_001704 [Paenibacillus favisporus]|uniref:Uncharacterized protein n=1 Tax=Paenibacillus favisporus TaxID=221028 RepID=A0ABV2EZZ5_9BACL